MLDPRLLRDNPEAVKAGARRKRIDADAAVDRFLALDADRRAIAFERDELKARQNKAGKGMSALSPAERDALRAEMGDVARRVRELERRLGEIEAELEAVHLLIPNIPAAEVPDGDSDRDNVEVRRWGAPRDFGFEPRDHIALGEALDLVDFPRAARLAGSRTYILKREGALLELAVLQHALQVLLDRGFEPMIVPTLVRKEPLVGTGYFPGGEEQAYACERDDVFLIGTSEVPVTAFHAGEILEEARLPLRYAGISTCYRREAGAAGKDTKGLYRIHQFNKIEQVVICRGDEEESKLRHREILENAEAILQSLELPYRVVNVSSGDLGAPQVQKFDVETWMPSRGGYGETHSASRFHDFQARRLSLRYRDAEGKVRFCHTLNNTAIASPRILIAILENYQEADGSVRVPRVLQPYLGGLEAIRR